jgi:histone deacetylase 6
MSRAYATWLAEHPVIEDNESAMDFGQWVVMERKRGRTALDIVRRLGIKATLDEDTALGGLQRLAASSDPWGIVRAMGRRLAGSASRAAAASVAAAASAVERAAEARASATDAMTVDTQSAPDTRSIPADVYAPTGDAPGSRPRTAAGRADGIPASPSGTTQHHAEAATVGGGAARVDSNGKQLSHSPPSPTPKPPAPRHLFVYGGLLRPDHAVGPSPSPEDKAGGRASSDEEDDDSDDEDETAHGTEAELQLVRVVRDFKRVVADAAETSDGAVNLPGYAEYATVHGAALFDDGGRARAVLGPTLGNVHGVLIGYSSRRCFQEAIAAADALHCCLEPSATPPKASSETWSRRVVVRAHCQGTQRVVDACCYDYGPMLRARRGHMNGEGEAVNHVVGTLKAVESGDWKRRKPPWICANCTDMNEGGRRRCANEECRALRRAQPHLGGSTLHLTAPLYPGGELSETELSLAWPDAPDADSAEAQAQAHALTSLRCGRAPETLVWSYDERMEHHRNPADDGCHAAATAHAPHPERPDRIRSVVAHLRWRGLLAGAGVSRLAAREATREELLACHDPEHVDRVFRTAQICLMGARPATVWRHVDEWRDVYCCPASSLAARLAAGTTVALTERVLRGQDSYAVALVRPPGHHAETRVAMGFCFFNNVAVAAHAALREGAKRILIVDWDVHHGNGIQEIFYDDPRVLYVSLHRTNFYPGTGEPHEVGRGEGAGFNLNVGWTTGGAGDAEYLAAFRRVVIPVCEAFRPELTFVSAGFDAAEGDPLGGCSVTPTGFAHMTAMLKALAGGKLVLLLEGGYNLRSISRSMAACVEVLLGRGALPPPPSEPPSTAALDDLAQTALAHARFWPCLRRPVRALQRRLEAAAAARARRAAVGPRGFGLGLGLGGGASGVFRFPDGHRFGMSPATDTKSSPGGYFNSDSDERGSRASSGMDELSQDVGSDGLSDDSADAQYREHDDVDGAGEERDAREIRAGTNEERAPEGGPAVE